MSFDEYRSVFEEAVANIPALREGIRRSLGDGYDNLLITGAGGVMILTHPALELLREQSSFRVNYARGAELLEVMPGFVNDRTLAVIPTVSGSTEETVQVVRRLKEAGARVMALTGKSESPIAQAADINVTTPMADPTSSEVFYLQFLVIALQVLQSADGKDIDGIVDELAQMPQILVRAKEQFADEAKRVAEHIAAYDWHIFTSAGSLWPEAHYYAMCILEEMQWIRTRPVHASDFFHGTLELVEAGVSVVILADDGPMRPLTDRVVRFVPRFSEGMAVLDIAGLDAAELSAETRALVSPALMATVLQRVSVNLEEIRNHPLTTRRYYKTVEY